MSGVRLGSGAPREAATQAVVVIALAGRLGDHAGGLDAALDGLLAEMLAGGEVRGDLGATTVVATLGRIPARRVLVLGLGEPAQLDTFRVHNAFRLGGEALRRSGVSSATAYLDAEVVAALRRDGMVPPALDGEPSLPLDEARLRAARAAAVGLLCANHDDGGLRSETERRPTLDEVVLAGDVDGVDEAVLRREAPVLADATNRVRDLAGAPGNVLTPTRFGERARAMSEGSGLEVEILTRPQLEELGMGSLLGVARGSDEPPVLIAVRHDRGAPDGPRLALVGKGITFDTGGISLKEPKGMELMKFDMAGGAAVLSAMRAIADLDIRANVIGIVPATENMPGGRATKPGDVLRSMSGTTIEVTNTDAEGRLILADGIAYARALGATHIVDVATLTGAVIVALGHVSAGIMGSHRGLIAMLTEAAAAAGDRVTEMPLYPEYQAVLRSDVADLKNSAGREGGAMTGAAFVHRFAGDTPWVHVDIAGAAWNDQGDMTPIPKGATGAPVRTLVELARRFAAMPRQGATG